jgi:polyphosphate:AMP phosphotransferase
MFDSAELGHKLSKEAFAEQEPQLRDDLLAVQTEVLKDPKFSTVIVIAGVDGAGKGDTANLLSEWFDPRYVTTHALGAPGEHTTRPPLYSAWNALPAKGRLAVFVGSWYTRPMYDRLDHTIDKGEFDERMLDIRNFESMLTSEDVLVIKFWLHLSKKAQRKRFETLEEEPLTRWRVTKEDWARHAEYLRFRRVAEQTIRSTSTADAPWTIVEAADREYRALTVGKTILETMKARQAQADRPRPDASRVPPRPPAIDKLNVLDALDMTKTIGKEEYDVELERLQGRLNLLFRAKEMRNRSVVAMFEGADAAGKGGAIRRITAALDARLYRVVPIAAPTPDDKAHPYLWRFWRNVPAHGQITIFDRSWYGRVLVERVEKYCSEDDWRRAYGEINDFEDQLVESGIIVVKYWLEITEDEQLKRFEEREKTPFKRYKIGPDDWRNRAKSSAYRDAVNEMVERTSTERSPWTLVESNDKRYARLKILATLCDRIEQESKRK